MRQIHRYEHQTFLQEEFAKLLVGNSFVSRSVCVIGEALEFRLVGWPDKKEVAVSSLFPVPELFIWIMKCGGLDIRWLRHEDGRYRGDDGKVIRKNIPDGLSGVEQLAAYGLWLIRADLDSCGPSGDWDERGNDPGWTNEHGWSKAEVLDHQAETLLLAYQALGYARRLLAGTSLTEKERARARNVDFAALGRDGGKARQAPMALLKQWTLDQYQLGEYRSPRHAGITLAPAVISHGRSINANLTHTNAARTIAEWIRNPGASSIAD